MTTKLEISTKAKKGTKSQIMHLENMFSIFNRLSTHVIF